MFNHVPVCIAMLLMIVFTACKKEQLHAVDLTRTDSSEDYETMPPVQAGVVFKVNNAINGYYRAVPAHYDSIRKKYPLLLSMIGAGQIGNGSTDLPMVLNDGVAKLIDNKKFPASFNVNGKYFSFIVLSPQFSYYPSVAEIASFVSFAKKNFAIDTARIYMTGLSISGILSADYAAAYPGSIAAIVPMAGVSTDNLSVKCRAIAAASLPLWAFHNRDDPKINLSLTVDFIAMLNQYHPAIVPKLTVFNAYGHDAWTQAIDPNYTENGKNIYEWMLQYSR